jgi:hypothetical protein
MHSAANPKQLHWLWIADKMRIKSWFIQGSGIRRIAAILAVFFVFLAGTRFWAHGASLASYPKWSKVELQFAGPDSIGMGTPNPFQIGVDVTFNGPGGLINTVPAFYDGDGAGGLDGNIWRVRFSPGAAGTWSYETSSAEPSLDGLEGSFEVTADPDCQASLPDGLPNFACIGRLQYTGEHYLKFADGPYWLKGGANEPEDFLVPGINAGFGSKQAAVDFLAGKGVNAIYLMLNNVEGDRKNIWPWVGSTQEEAKINHERFDVARLAEWESTFTYIQAKGLVLHIIFEDDSAWTGFNRGLYYREMIARFGHHNGLIWDLAEEYNESYYPDEIKSFAQLFSDLDPYGHPLTVHQEGLLSNWDPFLGDERFDLTSFQTGDTPQNSAAVEWFAKVEASGRTIPVSFDESTRTLTAEQRELFRHILWSIYTGGANFEAFTKLLGSGYVAYDLVFEDVGRARNFIDDFPHWEMQPMNPLLTSGEGYVFAKVGEVYMSYLPVGGSVTLDLSADSGVYTGLWFDPRDGATQPFGPVNGGFPQEFTAPDEQDWVLLLQVDQPPTESPTPTIPPTVTLSPSSTPTPTGPPTATQTPESIITPSPTPTPAQIQTATSTTLPLENRIFMPEIFFRSIAIPNGMMYK